MTEEKTRLSISQNSQRSFNAGSVNSTQVIAGHQINQVVRDPEEEPNINILHEYNRPLAAKPVTPKPVTATITIPVQGKNISRMSKTGCFQSKLIKNLFGYLWEF